MFKLFRAIAFAATLLSFMTVASISKAADPIRIPVLNWTSQIVMANVMAQIFEEMGHTAELVPAESASRYEAVRIGDLHVDRMKLGSQLWLCLFMKLWTKAD